MRSRLDRVGLTEGQRYTVAILAVLALLLSSSLTRLTGRLADFVAPLPGAAAIIDGSPLLPSVTNPPLASAPTRSAGAVGGVALGASTTVAPAAGPTPTTAGRGPVGTAPPQDDPEVTPCAADGANDAAREGIQALDAVTGGVVPDGSIISAVALASGCSEADPAVLLVAALIEVGQGLPDLGLDFIELPPLPFLELPAPVVAAMQPFRAAIDPVCGTAGIPVIITSQAGPHYQAPFDSVFAVSLFYALATCGQIMNPVP